jgi:NADH:ubiquinone oxidoreductase subunit B-like Fe-S oxidoreductase
VPVDVYLPGCPPRPEALIDAIRKLQFRIQEQGGDTLPETSDEGTSAA